ncbi:Peptidase family M23 [Humidesulfovibrio mexicanus]|uniref:Peptidase family M23 n=1 Tax=Humidesulfovibrio mexicanus TaxID=147047 RepID=A0A238XRG8_9BACT|nr:M23 family metallopeptidase [Humidesulfovibrio mexicanus]SNR61636.1 Peptidase family M23 [Humidesulfovibrio mexicanus]
MLFGKFHIVIFREKRGSTRKLQMRGWMLLGLGLLALALVVGNAILLAGMFSSGSLERSLSLTEKSANEQKTQLLNLSQKLVTLQKDVTRIRDFDSKLRVMINLEQENTMSVSSRGGPGQDMNKGYLPIYRQELLARKMNEFLRQLSVEARLEEVRQQEIMQRLRANKDVLESTPSLWPAGGWVTSGFGWRSSPFTSKREFHKGLDIAAPAGTPIFAPSRGIVSAVERDPAYGLLLSVTHGAGLTTRYAHLQRVNVKHGQVVQRGEVIAYMGDSGRSTGPHLHYEVRVGGVPVNPMRYILN